MSLTPFRARLLLLVLFLIAASGIRDRKAIPPPPRNEATDVGDVNLQLWTIERIRAGEEYYAAVGGELRKNGYPTTPIINWRTPLHYRAVAALSVERAGVLLFGLALAVVITGPIAYWPRDRGKGIAAALLLLGAMLPAMFVRPAGVVFPEMWAGVILALSLNAYVAEQWIAGAALGVIAVFVRELSAPYALVCGLIAFRARRIPESVVWIAGGVAYAAYYAVHASAASAAIQPADLVRESSYVRWLGLPFVWMTLHTYGWLAVRPPVLTPVAGAIGLAGTLTSSAPSQLRASLLGYFGLFCIVGQAFDYYWGYVTCAIWAHAFVHSVDGLRGLLASSRLTGGRSSGRPGNSRLSGNDEEQRSGV